MVDGSLLAQAGRWQMIIYADARVEFLSRLLLWPFAAVLGHSIFTYRLMSVFLGLLTVSAGGLAVRMFFLRYPRSVGRVALLAAMVGLGANQGFMTLSRAIYRSQTASPLVLLFLAFLWYGLYQVLTRRLRPTAPKTIAVFLAAGTCLGLTMHTYTSALVAALLGPLVGLYLLLGWGRQWRLWLGPMAVTGVTFLLLASPLLYLLVTNPERVFWRSEAVANPETRALLEQTLRLENSDYLELHKEWTLIRYIRKGDLNPQYNTSRAPLMPHRLAVMFYAGLAVCLVLLFRYEAGQVMALMVLSLIPVMLSNELFHGLRIILGYAVVPLLCGISLGILQWLITGAGRDWRLGRYASAGLVIGLGGYMLVEVNRIGPAYQAFFVENNPAGEARQADEPTLSDWYFRAQNQTALAYLRQQESPIYFPLQNFAQADVRATFLQDYPVTHSWTALPLDENGMPVLPSGLLYTLADFGNLTVTDYRLLVLAQGDSLYLLPPLTDEAAQHLRTALEAGQAHYAPQRPNWLVGRSLELANPSEWLTWMPITPANPIRFGERLQLAGITRPDAVTPGQATSYCLIWQPVQTIERNKQAVVELWNGQGQGLLGVQDDFLLRWLYPTSAWRVGDLVPTCYELALPPDSLPGLYWLAAAVTEPYFDPWAARDERGHLISPYSAAIAPLKVAQSAPIPAPSVDLEAEWVTPEGVLLRLQGYDWHWDEAAQTLDLTLYWTASAPTRQAYTIFIHLTDSNGQLLAQQDSQPWNGQYPTMIWSPDERVQSQHRLAWPDPLPDSAQLWVGWYGSNDLQRLPLQGPGGLDADGRIELPFPS
jgi:hypothetical protein